MIRTGLIAALTLVVALMIAPMTAAVAEEAADKAHVKTPALLTDAGQGNTARMVDMMLQRHGLEGVERDDLATVDDLSADHGALIIGVGASSKGLGAAGLDVNSEMDRIRALIEKAREHNIPVIGVHIGGEARRGELSDTFNRLVAENAAIMVVWEASDEDGFFKGISEAKETRYVAVAQRPQSGAAVAELFAVEEEDTE